MRINKNEKGYLMIEAAIVYPLIIIAVISVIYIGLLFVQKAVLQSAVEETLIYMKSTRIDDYVVGAPDSLFFTDDGAALYSTGNSAHYKDYENPFEKLWGGLQSVSNWQLSDLWCTDRIVQDSEINNMGLEMFRNSMKTSFVGNIDSFAKLSSAPKGDLSSEGITFYESRNVFQINSLSAQVVQKIDSPIKFSSFFGSDKLDSITLSADAEISLNNTDGFIRTMNFVSYLGRKSGAGDKVDDMQEKITKFINAVLS
ncbi:MAG: TadE/TadG family type IV pilus assembly protein [Huintestinicola sp.]